MIVITCADFKSKFFMTKSIKNNYLFLLFFVYLFDLQTVYAQNPKNYLGDETPFYAATKQMNQFFRRFNNEEDANGKPYFSTDKNYREPEKRKKYINVLFDGENLGIPQNVKTEFIQTVTSKDKGQFLDFHAGRWFAEVKATFNVQGKQESFSLFLDLQKERLGSKWVLSNVYFPAYNNLFLNDTIGMSKKFLHPQSHEIEFMNLAKAFEQSKEIEFYAKSGYRPDYVSIFFYDLKRGTIKFEAINEVKFHFFQINNWYFEVSNFNRTGNNAGWLISNLIKVPENQKNILEKFIFTKR